VLLVTLRVPPLMMAEAWRALPPLAMVRFWTVNVPPTVTEKTPTLLPPLSVIRPPPSMVVSVLIKALLWVTVIVTGLGPQLKVTLPPPPQMLNKGGDPIGEPHARAVSSAASVQLSGVPLPTTPMPSAGIERSGARASNTANTAERDTP
jgi:hypothetical protein